MEPTRMAKPTAIATVEPRDRRSDDHLVKITIRLSAGDARFSDRRYVADTAGKALDGFGVRQRRVEQLTSKHGKELVAIGVEVSVIWPHRPSDDLIEGLRASLAAEGYKVVLRETRACAEDECGSETAVEWNHSSDVPKDWHSASVCGKHNYKRCAHCGTIYRMSNSNSPGPAPSLHCAVCGVVLIEWGGSKIWDAELITRGEAGRR